ncbi:MAG TPA: hypothetical protein VJK54_02080, partial [Chthoniobacterales bacterium]|nr:hypothetical protein [Chthoniobacterales bacterium]
MKKTALIIALIFLAVGLWVFLTLRHLGPNNASRLVPSDTLAIVEFPDLASTIHRWDASALGKMGTEAEIKAFLERPLEFFHKWSASSTEASPSDSVEALIVKLKVGRTFAALVPRPEVKDQDLGWVVGCQFFGGKDQAEAVLLRLHQFLDTHAGTGDKITLDIKENQGDIITRSSHGALVLYSVIHGNWCFIGSQVEPIKKSLDFLAARRAEKESLAANERYQKNRTQLPKDSDALFYTIPGDMMTMVMGAHPIMGNSFTTAESLGFALRFVNEEMQETLFLQGNFPSTNSLSHEGLGFSHLASVGYIEWINDWQKMVGHLEENKTLPASALQFLGSSGMDLASLTGNLKPEGSAIFDWPTEQPFPTALLSVPLMDAAKANTWLDQAALHLNATIKPSQEQGVRLLPLQQMGPMLQPTLAMTPSAFLVGTDSKVVEQATTANNKTSDAGKTLKDSPDFAKVLPLYREANEVFAYFSTRELFERLYGKARPGLIMSASMAPGMSTFVDLSKLPKSETISKYLTPIVYTQSHNKEGLLIHSQGPVSATPLLLLGSTIYSITKQSLTMPGAPGA